MKMNRNFGALACTVFLAAGLCTGVAYGATEEKMHQQFQVGAGGALVVEVDFGSIDVVTNETSEVVVDVWRSVTRRKKTQEEEYLKEHPVLMKSSNGTVTVRALGAGQNMWGWRNRNEARYTVRVPGRFRVDLKTSGGSIKVAGLVGNAKAVTSGGSLSFSAIQGQVEGRTSGGSVSAADCDGGMVVHTSGGRIEVDHGAGVLDGKTSGGGIAVKQFKGPVVVRTSGGPIHIEQVAGGVEASTSGGSIHASLTGMPERVKLSTSGGSIRLALPENSSFELDAATSGGSVSSELPVVVMGKLEHSRLNGTVNQGGPQVYLRTSGGNIDLRKR